MGELIDVLALKRYYGWYIDGGDLDVTKAERRELRRRWSEIPDFYYKG